jgi:hypothetical protein
VQELEMKLPDYAKAIGISYTTAWRWWKANKLPHPARQTESGLIIVDYLPQPPSNKAKKTESLFIIVLRFWTGGIKPPNPFLPATIAEECSDFI